MKHLKIFELFGKNKFTLKEHFTPLINWKFIEYLKDKTIEFSDTGHNVSIKINCILNNDIKSGRPIYYVAYINKGELQIQEGWFLQSTQDVQYNISKVTHLEYEVCVRTKHHSDLTEDECLRYKNIVHIATTKFNTMLNKNTYYDVSFTHTI